MPSGRYTRIEITPEAYMGLEAEAILQGKTLKRLASELILKGISHKALRFIHEGVKSFYEESDGEDISEQATLIMARRPRISENNEAIEQIKVLWSQNPRPSQREIAKIIDYPASSTKYLIKNMLEKGLLKM
jgi:predicted HTH transcriptional regulator